MNQPEPNVPEQVKGAAQTKLCTTTCPYCGVGCGVEVTKTTSANQNQVISHDSAQYSGKKDVLNVELSNLKGRSDHPANFGKLCVKGSNLLGTNDLSGRLLTPKVGGKETSWQHAVNEVATKFKQAIEQYGPDSVAFYVSGQLLTEDYYVANKLMKGYIGSANIDTNSRLCMSSAVAGYKRAFGSDTVPCNYQDLELTELLVLVGSNAAWTHPVLFQRIERAKQLNPNMRIVVVDPRKTSSCEIADHHLAIAPGTDAYLFNGLLSYLNEGQYLDEDFINDHTEGFGATLSQASNHDVSEVASICDVDYQTLLSFYEAFAKSSSAITFYSMGINQSTSGVDKANAIINCHLASGKIGKVGSGPFSITGQPNAMGGREVGGLANMLAAHMDIASESDRNTVQTFWHSPRIPVQNGLKAVDLFNAVEQGQIKAIWVMATNPLVSMPNREQIETALEKCPFVVVSDVVEKNDTLEYADVALPATAWSEKDGTVTNSERCISRQQAIMPAPGATKHDWKIICEVAKAMGFNEGFNFEHASDVFKEHASLSGFQNQGSRDFDISGLADISQTQYDALQPIQWPVNAKAPNGTPRMFTDKVFFTASKKAQFIAIAPRLPTQQTSNDYPFVLNTGRLRDQWHTMTRTGKAAALCEHVDEPFVAIHPDTAASLNIQESDWLALSASVNQTPVVLRAKLESGQQKSALFAPIHWGKTNSSSASIAALFDGSNDPISGQPELKHAAVSISKCEFVAEFLIVTKVELPQLFLSSIDYWVVSKIEEGYCYKLASNKPIEDVIAQIDGLLISNSEVFRNISSSHYQLLSSIDGRLYFAVFANTLSAEAQPTGLALSQLSSQWLNSLMQQSEINLSDIGSLLRRQPSEEFLAGKLICSCFKVREKTIEQAIDDGADTVEKLGGALKCGTNCGSCKTELAAMINDRARIAITEL